MPINWNQIGVQTAIAASLGALLLWLFNLLVADKFRNFLKMEIETDFVSKELIEGKLKLIENRVDYLEKNYKELYEYSHLKGHDLANINTTIGIMAANIESYESRMDNLTRIINILERHTSDIKSSLENGK